MDNLDRLRQALAGFEPQVGLGPHGEMKPMSVFEKRSTGLVLVLVIEEARRTEDEHEDDDE